MNWFCRCQQYPQLAGWTFHLNIILVLQVLAVLVTITSNLYFHSLETVSNFAGWLFLFSAQVLFDSWCPVTCICTNPRQLMVELHCWRNAGRHSSVCFLKPWSVLDVLLILGISKFARFIYLIFWFLGNMVFL